MEYSELNEKQKLQFQEVCDREFGKTVTFVSDTKEPMYFDKNTNLLPNNELIKLIFPKNLN